MNRKKVFADQLFRYDLGLRMFNLLRTVFMLVAMINTFLIMFHADKLIVIIAYVGSILFATVGIWFVGYILDKKKMQYFLDQAYFDRGKAKEKFEELNQRDGGSHE